MYYLLPGNDYTLYGNANAASPKPNGLFREEAAGMGAPPGATKKWTANVRLVDAKMYRTQGREAVYNLPMNALNRQHELDLFRDKSDQDCRGYTAAIGKKLQQDLSNRILSELNARLRNRRDIAVISPNDCARFAMVLKNLIASESNVSVGEFRTKEVRSHSACFRRGLGVGESIVLKFPTGGRHGITAVAVNRGAGAADQVVTLEAHASRWLTEPQFHIYDVGTLNDLLMTWYTPDTVVDPRSIVTFAAKELQPGEIDVGTTVPYMTQTAISLTTLVGRTYRGGPKTNKEIWHLIGSAGGVPALLRG